MCHVLRHTCKAVPGMGGLAEGELAEECAMSHITLSHPRVPRSAFPGRRSPVGVPHSSCTLCADENLIRHAHLHRGGGI